MIDYSFMEIVWNQTAQSFWDAAHAAQGGAMQQDWAYGASLAALGIPCYRAQVSHRGEVIALAQFVCRRYAWTVGFALCTRGPIWLRSLDPVEQAAVYRALKRSLPMARPRFALFSPDIVDTGHLSVRKLFRVLTGYSTVRIDLTQSAEARRAAMEGRWRNRLVASERAGIQIVRADANPTQYRWLLEEELSQRDSKSFYGLPVEFIEHYIHSRANTTKTVLILRAEHHNERIAAMLFLIHGSAATYHVGWSNEAGRTLNAHNLLLWRACDELHERGIKVLDLGGINTRSLAGISRFKIGSGGEVVTYAGTFI